MQLVQKTKVYVRAECTEFVEVRCARTVCVYCADDEIYIAHFMHPLAYL